MILLYNVFINSSTIFYPWVSAVLSGAVLSTEALFHRHRHEQLSKNAKNIRNLFPFWRKIKSVFFQRYIPPKRKTIPLPMMWLSLQWSAVLPCSAKQPLLWIVVTTITKCSSSWMHLSRTKRRLSGACLWYSGTSNDARNKYALNFYITLCRAFLAHISMKPETNALKIAAIQTAEPLNKKLLFEIFAETQAIFTLSESFLSVFCIFSTHFLRSRLAVQNSRKALCLPNASA